MVGYSSVSASDPDYDLANLHRTWEGVWREAQTKEGYDVTDSKFRTR